MPRAPPARAGRNRHAAAPGPGRGRPHGLHANSRRPRQQPL